MTSWTATQLVKDALPYMIAKSCNAPDCNHDVCWAQRAWVKRAEAWLDGPEDPPEPHLLLPAVQGELLRRILAVSRLLSDTLVPLRDIGTALADLQALVLTLELPS